MGNRVQHRKPDWDGDYKDEPVFGPRDPVKDWVAVLILRDLERLSRPAINEAHKHDAEHSSMSEVDGKTVSAEPHEELVGEDPLESGRQPDSSYAEVPSNGGPTF